MMLASLAAAVVAGAAGVAAGMLFQRWRDRRGRVVDRAARRIVENMPTHSWSQDASGNFTYVSKSLAAFFGLDLSYFDLGRAGCEEFEAAFREIEKALVHPDDLQRTAGKWRDCHRTGVPFVNEHRLRRADGVYRWFRVVSVPVRDATGAVEAWYGTQVDIEDAKQAELALRQRESELQLLIDTVPVQIWCCAPDGGVTYFNARLRDYIGRLPEDFQLGTARFEDANRVLIHPEDLQSTNAGFRHSLTTGETFAMRFRVRRADGVYRWTDQRAEPLRDSEGRIVQWYGVCLDVDELKRTEDALRRSERDFRDLLDTLPAMVWGTRAVDGPTYFNKTLLDYTGYQAENAGAPGGTEQGRALRELVHPDDQAYLRQSYERSYLSGELVVHRYRVRRNDGVFRWVEGRSASMRDAAGELAGRYGILVDVDDEVRSQGALREAQERLSRASQAASLAELSASIAHEVNQPLAAVIANAQACQFWLSNDPPNLERAMASTDRVVGDAEAAAEVIARVRALFKRSPIRRSLEDINMIVAEVCDLLVEEAAASGVNLEPRLAAGLPRLEVDRVQIQQVLVNLIRNGIEASIPLGRGVEPVVIRSLREGDEIVIDISDRGAGAVDAERAFEPFFTTKEGGMGMGLAISRSIVELHGGRLWMVPNQPRGTTVGLALPFASVVPDAVRIRS